MPEQIDGIRERIEQAYRRRTPRSAGLYKEAPAPRRREPDSEFLFGEELVSSYREYTYEGCVSKSGYRLVQYL